MSGCCGGNSKTNIMACSGAADVGFLSDRTARMLSVAGIGSMYCLAGIGADIESFIKGAKDSRNIVIDGCPVKCGKKAMDKRGLESESYVVTDFGFVKGETGMSEDTVKNAFIKIQEAVIKRAPSEDKGQQGKSSCGCGGNC